MADWTNIDDTFVEPGKPVRSADGLALRDNPVAIAEGASGAPKIELDALSTNVTLQATVRDYAAGAVGTKAFLRVVGDSTDRSEGYTRPGSELKFSNADGSKDGNTPSGTWLQLGFTSGSGSSVELSPSSTTLFLRIA